jgi:hypothetical protein
VRRPECHDVLQKKGKAMKTRFAVMIALTLTASLCRAEVLKKLSLDAASSATPRIEVDTQVKAEGQGSLKITTQWPTTICLGEIVAPDVENAKLVYAAKVKTALAGSAFLEMWAHVGGGQYFSRGVDEAVSQNTEWKTIQTPFIFQKGQKPEKITLNLVINGTGTVWIDDIILSREP